MMKNLKPASAAILLCVISTVGHSSPAVEGLSPELRELLSEEMLALQEGMQAIVPAYASGDLERVAHIAERMKNSFILKQKITSEQKHELMSKLPTSFVRLDQTFHEQAGMLERVAKEERTELVGFYFYKLTESCVGCHSDFASHKFPKLRKEATEPEHHH